MKFCSKCHEQYNDNFVFCPKCKSALTEDINLKSNSTETKLDNNQIRNEIRDLNSQSENKTKKHKNIKLHGASSSKSRRLKIFRRIALCCICFVLILGISVFGFIKYYLGLIERDDIFSGLDKSDIGISDSTHTDESIINIALFGTDSRQNDDKGRADAQMIVTIDKKHNKIKLTSIARDTKVKVDGYGYQKITNAWRFGAMSKNKNVTASSLAVKTLNQNFNLDVMDYVEVNFFQFAEIIDYLGGVELDVDSAEMKVINKTYIPYIKKMGINCKPIKKTGLQLLSGGQALAYARNRYTGDDITRGGKQREVIIAIYEKFKDTNVSEYPALISMVLPNCVTSLSDSEIFDLTSWAALNKPTIEQLSMPTKELKAGGQMINGAWHFVYDLDKASQILHNFIYEPETK